MLPPASARWLDAFWAVLVAQHRSRVCVWGMTRTGVSGSNRLRKIGQMVHPMCLYSSKGLLPGISDFITTDSSLWIDVSYMTRNLTSFFTELLSF